MSTHPDVPKRPKTDLSIWIAALIGLILLGVVVFTVIGTQRTIRRAEQATGEKL